MGARKTRRRSQCRPGRDARLRLACGNDNGSLARDDCEEPGARAERPSLDCPCRSRSAGDGGRRDARKPAVAMVVTLVKSAVCVRINGFSARAAAFLTGGPERGARRIGNHGHYPPRIAAAWRCAALATVVVP